MAEPIRPSLLDRPLADTGDYKPLSGTAVAAIIVAGLFALILVIITVTAFVSRKPVLLFELLFLPILGVILSIGARFSIARAEGTRAGAGLGVTAWWISVLGGAAYASYLFATQLAIEQQTRREMGKWFEQLKEGKVDAAFIFTLPPKIRNPAPGQSLNPDDKSSLARFGPRLFQFRNSELVQMIQRNRDNATMEVLGTRDSRQEQDGFVIVQTFQFRSVEGRFESILTQVGQEGRPGEGRQWYIDSDKSGWSPRAEFTPYGKALQELRDLAGTQAQTMMGVFANPGARPLLFELTKPLDQQRADLLTQDPTDLLRAGGEVGQSPAYQAYLTQLGFFRYTNGSLDDEQKKLVTRLWLAGSVKPSMDYRAPNISFDGTKVTTSYIIELLPPGVAGKFYSARVILTTDHPPLIAKLNELLNAAKADPNTLVPNSEPILPRYEKLWRFEGLESDLEEIELNTPSGGPPRPGMLTGGEPNEAPSGSGP